MLAFLFAILTFPPCIHRYVGRLFVKALGKPTEILTKLNKMAGFSPSEEIELYEVSAAVAQKCFTFVNVFNESNYSFYT